MRSPIGVSLLAGMDHTRSSPFEGRGRAREDPMDADARMFPGPDGPQHLQALQRANAVRLARAELKRRGAGGDGSAREGVPPPPRGAAAAAGPAVLTRPP